MSPVATDNTTTPAAADDTPATPTWTRNAVSWERLDQHREKVTAQYSHVDPRLLALYQDVTILTTNEVAAFLKMARTSIRVHQLNLKQRDLAAAGQIPHPSAITPPDAVGNISGPRRVQGTTLGPLAKWALQSGRLRFDPFTGETVAMTGINFGGAPAKST